MISKKIVILLKIFNDINNIRNDREYSDCIKLNKFAIPSLSESILRMSINIACDGYKMCQYLLNLKIYDDIFNYFIFIQDKKIYENILTYIYNIYENTTHSNENNIKIISNLKLKNFLISILKNYKIYSKEIILYALSLIRNILYHSKSLMDIEIYKDFKKLLEVNNIPIFIDELNLSKDDKISSTALLILEENWEMKEIYLINQN